MIDCVSSDQTLDAVCVSVPASGFLGAVADRLVRPVGPLDPDVARMLVLEDGRRAARVLHDEGVERLAVGLVPHHKADRPVTLDRADHHRLIAGVATLPATRSLRAASVLPADVRLFYFDKCR